MNANQGLRRMNARRPIRMIAKQLESIRRRVGLRSNISQDVAREFHNIDVRVIEQRSERGHTFPRIVLDLPHCPGGVSLDQWVCIMQKRAHRQPGLTGLAPHVGQVSETFLPNFRIGRIEFHSLGIDPRFTVLACQGQRGGL